MRTYLVVVLIAVAVLLLPSEGAHAVDPVGPIIATSLPSLAATVASATLMEAGYQSGFGKVQRKRIAREVVWFDGREADLEHHARVINGRIYITLTDLSRHLGCSILWGPSRQYIEVSKGDKTVVLCPCGGGAHGVPHVSGPPAIRKQGLTWVPVEPFATLFGATVTWNAEARRLDVATAPAQ